MDMAGFTWLKPSSQLPLQGMPNSLHGSFILKQLGLVLGIAVWVLGVWVSPSFALTVQEIPNPRHQEAWVSDVAAQISAPMERRLNGLLTFLEQQTGVEMAVVTLPAAPPDRSLKAFATELFNTWGIGKAEENNGVLMLLAIANRQIEIETGSGLAIRLPGDRLTAILQQTMRPAFQQGDIDAGVWGGTAAIVAELAGIDPNAPIAPSEVRSRYRLLLLVGVSLAGLGGLWILWLAQQPALLPPTGTHSYTAFSPLQEISFERLVASTPHSPTWPRWPLALLGTGLTLSAGAIAFWVLALAYIPYDTHSAYLGFLTVGLGSLLSVALLQPLYYFLRAQTFKWQAFFMDGVIVLLGGGVSLVLFGFGLFLALWNRFTPVTAPLQVWGVIPLYVGLWNAGIAAYFVQDNAQLRRTPPTYLCETCHGAIAPVDASSPDLKALFPPRPGITHRGWRCVQCHPSLSTDSLFLITQTVSPKPYRSSGTAQTSYSSAAVNSTPDTSSTWDDVTTWDTGSSGGSDFGGGSSEGGGAGDQW